MKTKATIALAMIMIPASLMLMSCNKDNETLIPTDNSAIEKALYAEDSAILQTPCDSIIAEPLSAEETAALLQLREEELLAHDVYTALAVYYPVPVFTFIPKSELRHASAILRLLQKYQLEDPAANHQAGVFSTPELQELYNTLVEQGSVSFVDALTVGATIEDLDIRDLMDLMLIVDNQDISWVFANLTKGSRNHLRSFSKQLTLNGSSYAPQYISEELYLQIINSPYERGPVKP